MRLLNGKEEKLVQSGEEALYTGHTVQTREGKTKNKSSALFFGTNSCFVTHMTLAIFVLQKEKRRKWIFGIGRLKIKRLPSITAPPVPSKEPTQEVVEFSAHQSDEETQEFQLVKSRNEAAQPTYQCQREVEESGAIKIQTAFRGFLVSLFKHLLLISTSFIIIIIFSLIMFTFSAKCSL